jgi:hypothetical protein
LLFNQARYRVSLSTQYFPFPHRHSLINTFNLLPKDSALRFDVLTNIIEYSSEKDMLSKVSHLFKNVGAILENFGADTVEQRRGAYSAIAQALEKSGSRCVSASHDAAISSSFGFGSPVERLSMLWRLTLPRSASFGPRPRPVFLSCCASPFHLGWMPTITIRSTWRPLARVPR